MLYGGEVGSDDGGNGGAGGGIHRWFCQMGWSRSLPGILGIGNLVSAVSLYHQGNTGAETLSFP